MKSLLSAVETLLLLLLLLPLLQTNPKDMSLGRTSVRFTASTLMSDPTMLSPIPDHRTTPNLLTKTCVCVCVCVCVRLKAASPKKLIGTQ